MRETRDQIVHLLSRGAGVNADRVERHIYAVLFPEDEEDEEGRTVYQHLLYNFVYMYDTEDETSCSRVTENILKARSTAELKHAMFSCRMELAENQKMRDEYITNPMEVSEGVEPCPKCRSTKSYSYQKQLRSGDEGFSTICTCANPKCRYRWRIN